MNRQLKQVIALIVSMTGAIAMCAQDYSGLWAEHSDDEVLDVYTFITLSQTSSNILSGQLVWEGVQYDLIFGYTPRRKSSYLEVPVSIRYGAREISAFLHIYPWSSNRIDFICNERNVPFKSLYRLYNGEIAAQIAWQETMSLQNSTSGSSRDKAVAVAQKLIAALINADVEQLKQCMTTDAYNRYSGGRGDRAMREHLLAITPQKRNMLRKLAEQNRVTTIPNRAGDAITVIFSDSNSNEICSMQLFDIYNTGNWKVSDIQ